MLEENKNCNKYKLPNSCYLIGPTGPTGPIGTTETIEFRNTITGDEESNAQVIDTTGSPNHILDIIIPRGKQGLIGPTGPKGSSVSIKGSYLNYEDLIKEHPKGNINDAYLVNGDLYVWSENNNNWENVGRIQGPKGEKGDIGPIGPTGPAGISRSAYLVTYNYSENEDGIEVLPNNKLPIERKEIDATNLVDLNTNDNTIKFNAIGYYKISFIVSAYTQATDIEFNPHRDFVSLGFKMINTDNIYIGASEWIYDETATQIMAHGIISVENPNNIYALYNVGNYTIFLNTPDLNDINSNSYFTNSLITIIIEYLGKQKI